MSKLVFLLVYSGKINLFCLLVKRTLKPLTSGEVARFTVTERAADEHGLFLPFANFLVPTRMGDL